MAGTGVRVSPLWLVTVYGLHTMGELCLSPVGLSAMTKLAPARISGLLMGVWFLSISIGNYMGGRIASLYEALPLPALFGVIAVFGMGAGVILALFVKPTVKLMGGVK
jgi:POT family proton-dependent oligopeptide transporter